MSPSLALRRRAARPAGPPAPRRAGSTTRRDAAASGGARVLAATERFRTADRYRADREWGRYEGTSQRDLWRELRERFLDRHAAPTRWALDLGSGPGRFTGRLGGPTGRRVALDLSREMLRQLPFRLGSSVPRTSVPDRVRGDGRHPPFPPDAFGEVAVLGNSLGFAGPGSDRLWEEATRLVAPGGILILEIAPDAGERSRYLARLPVGSVGRLLRAPVEALLPRLEREGFAARPARKAEAGEFRRIPAEEALGRLRRAHWEIRETLAVAPALGSEPERADACRADRKSWEHLVRLEEVLGRRPERWIRAAAVLIAAAKEDSVRTLK